MRLRKVSIRNVRSIEELDWEIPEKARWNVVLGNNGSGKSTFLRAVSLGLIGPREAIAARQDWSAWLRHGATEASISLDLQRSPDYDAYSLQGKTTSGDVVVAAITLRSVDGIIQPTEPTVTMKGESHVWGTGQGWFSAAYGPFRRFAGGDKDAERIFLTNPRLGAHLSVYHDSVALTEVLAWLRDLNYKKLESDSEGALLDSVKSFVNQDGFLPHDVRMGSVSSHGVRFVETGGKEIFVDELSDGYRSILSMTLELIRQIWARFKQPDRIFGNDCKEIIVPGVVLIDEVDAHLHPTWQKEIGFWLTRHFPNMQFIVSTHSPLVCHAAINGSIFLLPRPGEDETGRMLAGIEFDRLIYGDILDAYSTGAFGDGGTRSEQANSLMQRLADLNVKEIREGLTGAERTEQRQLRATFPMFEQP